MDWTAFSLSLKLAAATCVLIFPIAIAAARALAWGRFKGKSLVEAALMLPLVLPPTVLGYYMLVGFAPSSALGRVAILVTGHPLAFTFAGILLASLIVNLPFAIAPMQRAFESIPVAVREAAWVSGLSPLATFARIELPLSWPGIVSAMALVFAHTLGEFGVVLMIGGNIPGETRTLSIAVYDAVQSMRQADAGLMAAALLGFSFLAILIVQLSAKRSRSRP